MRTSAKEPSASPSQTWYKKPLTIALLSTGGATVLIIAVANKFYKYLKERRIVELDNQVGVENRAVKAHPMLKLAWSDASEGRRAESEL